MKTRKDYRRVGIIGLILYFISFSNSDILSIGDSLRDGQIFWALTSESNFIVALLLIVGGFIITKNKIVRWILGTVFIVSIIYSIGVSIENEQQKMNDTMIKTFQNPLSEKAPIEINTTPNTTPKTTPKTIQKSTPAISNEKNTEEERISSCIFSCHWNDSVGCTDECKTITYNFDKACRDAHGEYSYSSNRPLLGNPCFCKQGYNRETDVYSSNAQCIPTQVPYCEQAEQKNTCTVTPDLCPNDCRMLYNI